MANTIIITERVGKKDTDKSGKLNESKIPEFKFIPPPPPKKQNGVGDKKE